MAITSCIKEVSFMFDFSILISIIIAILIFYFTLYINLNKEIGDLSSASKNSRENYLKINNRKRKLKLLNIITLVLVVLIILLYFFPNIIIIFQNIDLTNLNPITFSDIKDFMIKLIPFKKGFFSNKNFKLSYITESILSTILIIIFSKFLYFIRLKKGAIIFFSIISAYIFIWINKFVSQFLVYCILHCFPFLSITFNLLVYTIIPLTIILSIYICIDTLPSDDSKSEESTTSNEKSLS